MGRYQQDAKELLAAVGGLILGFRNCIDSMYLLENGTKTLVQVSQFWSGVDSFLWLIGEAIFHMLPVCICWSVTKKMGTTQSLGIVCTATSTTANSVGVGGLPGITAKLDYLKDLGVDYLWLTPFFPSPQRDNGYDVADYRAVDPRFGTMADLETLAQRSRDNGRTPMQWDAGPNAGFTAGTPWIGAAGNYRAINAAAETGDPDLLAYRRWDGESELLVLCNLTAHDAPVALPGGWQTAGVLLDNYPDAAPGAPLRPYEALVLER